MWRRLKARKKNSGQRKAGTQPRNRTSLLIRNSLPFAFTLVESTEVPLEVVGPVLEGAVAFQALNEFERGVIGAARTPVA